MFNLLFCLVLSTSFLLSTEARMKVTDTINEEIITTSQDYGEGGVASVNFTFDFRVCC